MTTIEATTKILIVEDEVLIAADLEFRLKGLGYSVCGKTSSAEQALEEVEQHQPNLVIMDIVLKGDMDGIEAAEIIKDKWDIPVVFLTAYADSDQLERAKPTYPFGYITKPFQDKDLKITVEMALYVSQADIKRREAEKALAESESRFKLLYEQAPLPYQSLDDEGNFIQVNQSWLNTLGYTLDEVIGRNFGDFLHQDWIEHFKLNFPRFKAVGEILGVEFEMVKKDGSTILVAFNGKIDRDDQGRFKRTYCIFQDITDRRQAEEALRESDQRFRQLVKLAPLPLCFVTKEGFFTYFNDRFVQVFGYTHEDLPTIKEWWQLAYPDRNYRRSVVKTWEAAIERAAIEGKDIEPLEYNVTCKNGSVRVMVISGISFDDNFLATFVDITERKRAEEALEKRIVALTRPLDDTRGLALDELFNLDDIQHLQDEFARATGVASLITRPDGTPITTPSGFCRLCNDIIRNTEKGLANCRRSYAAIGRLSAQGPVVQPCMSGGIWAAGAGISVGGLHIASWLIGQVRDETQTESNMRSYAREIGADETAVVEAFREVPAMSRERFGHVAQALFTLANQLSSMAYQNVQQARFIADLKRTEQEKEQLQSQLQQAQKMEAVGTLAGGIAHDFNNLLQAINGYTQLMLIDKSENDPDYPNLEAVLRAGGRARDLVRQLLFFSRKVETKKTSVELNQEVRQAHRMLRRAIPKMVDIELHLESRLWAINADPVQIEQMLLNLGTNAADALPDGGKLVIETKNIVLDEDYARNHLEAAPGRFVLLTVSDTGHGMDQETVEHIFEPFFTTKAIGKGTGLGLASVYGIVKSHGGFINCYSEVALGTTFKIYLPAIEPENGRAADDFSETAPKGGTERILLVDDEAPIRDFASKVLERFGYTVVTAASGEEALEIHTRNPAGVDLVIMDIGMPGMGGHKCLGEILRLDRSAKVLIASGYSINGQLKDTIEADAVGYVGKPYQVNDLLHKVRAVLDEND